MTLQESSCSQQGFGLIGRSVGRLVGRSVGRSIGWLVGRAIGWLVGRSIFWEFAGGFCLTHMQHVRGVDI